jgi:phosphoglycolate phosphatase
VKSEERRYDLVVWDWDGTIMDSTPTIVHCIQQACRDLDFPVPDDSIASYVIGLGVQDSLRRVVPTVHPARFPELVERFRYHYLAKDHELHLFVGIRELLEDLKNKGFMLGVATGKPRRGLDRSLNFHETRTADESFSKPHPGMLLDLSDSLQVPVRKMLMIGDTTHDLEMAQSAGVDGVAVSYGAHPADALKAAKSLACLDNVEQLVAWLQNNLYVQHPNPIEISK